MSKRERFALTGMLQSASQWERERRSGEGGGKAVGLRRRRGVYDDGREVDPSHRYLSSPEDRPSFWWRSFQVRGEVDREVIAPVLRRTMMIGTEAEGPSRLEAGEVLAEARGRRGGLLEVLDTEWDAAERLTMDSEQLVAQTRTLRRT